MKRGQNSLELVVLLGFAMLIFISFFVVIQGKIREQNDARHHELYAQLADKIEKEVLIAAKVNDGFMRSFDMPLTLEGEPYEVTLEDSNTVAIKGNYSENEYLRFLGVNVTVVYPSPSGADPHDVILPRPGIANEFLLVLQKNASGLYLRNDCETVKDCI